MTERLPGTVPADGDLREEWPIPLAGITETIVTTPNPDDTWHQATFGLHSSETQTGSGRCWGQTTTARNLARTGDCIFQFSTDPLVFVEAALSDCNTSKPIFESTNAWTRAVANQVETGTKAGTKWSDWQFRPQAGGVRNRTVGVVRRGTAAVIEALVAASRLHVPSYDRSELLAQIDRSRSLVDRCGTDRDQTAFRRLEEFIED